MFRQPPFRPDGRATGRFLPLAPLAALLVLAACEETTAPRMQLSLSEATVEFRAIRGAPDPLTRTVAIRNDGGGRLGPVTCPADPEPWLTCSVSGGSVVTFTADPSQLTQDPEPVSVTLSAPGGSASVEVRLVLEQPVLAVDPGSLVFTAAEGETGVAPSSATITVTNTGAGTVQNLGALTCAPAEPTPNVACSVDQGSGTLTVTANAQDLSPGNHLFTLRVSAEHSAVTQDVAVGISVAALPRIGLSRQTVRFEGVRGGDAPAAQTVTVSNIGGGTLGTVSCPVNPAPWLLCSVSGTTVTLTADPTGLTEDPGPVSVPIAAAGAINSPTPVEVSFRIRQPILSLTRNTLEFTSLVDSINTTPSQDTLRAINTGAGTDGELGTLTCTRPTGSPVTCTVDQANRVITASVNPLELPRGVHAFPVEVSAEHSDVTRTLTVQLTVDAPPTLDLTPPVRHFEAIRGSTAPISQTVAISNAGGGSLGTLTCPASPAGWLTCVVNDSTQLTLTANPAGLPSSPPPVDVPVSAAGAVNSPDTVSVSFSIQQPILALDADEVSFTSAEGSSSTTPASATVALSNAGAGDFIHLGDVSCTAPSPVGCSVSGNELTLTADPSGLAVGTHVRVVTVGAKHTSNTRTVTVVITVE